MNTNNILPSPYPQNELVPGVTELPAANGLPIAVLSRTAPGRMPAHPADYPTAEHSTASASDWMGGPGSEEMALDYANNLFPGSSFSVLSAKGSTAIVLDDGQGNVFKIYRTSHRYSWYEDEAAALERLSGLGVAPRPYALVDVPIDLRTDMDPKNDFKAEITRVESECRYPSLIMEKINARPLSSLPAEQAAQKFLEFWDAIKGQRFAFHDVELVYDTDKDRVVVLDASGMSTAQSDEEAYRTALHIFTSDYAGRYAFGNQGYSRHLQEVVDGKTDLTSFIQRARQINDDMVNGAKAGA